jgi:hypothetical protein
LVLRAAIGVTLVAQGIVYLADWLYPGPAMLAVGLLTVVSGVLNLIGRVKGGLK